MALLKVNHARVGSSILITVWLFDRIKHFERALIDLKSGIDSQNGSYIPASITVVGSGPHGDQVPFWKHELVAFLDELMRSTNKHQVVYPVKLREGVKNIRLYISSDLMPKEEPSTAGT